MTLLVDGARWRRHGRRWAHLSSDTSLAELHAAAAALGVPRRRFHDDHYDLSPDERARAVRDGAEAVSAHELVRRIRAGGTRRRRTARSSAPPPPP